VQSGAHVLRAAVALLLISLARAQQAQPLTPADLSSFFDGLVPALIERDDIAGVVIAVVKDDQLLFSKGYGWADVSARRPVTVDGTLFRPGSISKLFTWTALMQLIEQDKLALDGNVNAYLDFKIPAAYSRSITFRDIMTHTAGFEESAKDFFVKSAADLRPLSEYLPSHLPARIFPPGTTPAYSNYATALAGYIVQRVSGQPYERYVEDHILKPLKMSRTTFVQPLPTDLQPFMSQGYRLGSQPAKDFEFVEPYPAGALTTTASDIVRFIRAQLRGGELDGARILGASTLAQMHDTQFILSPVMNNMCFGFYEEWLNGHRIIGHGGDTLWFHSALHLMEDQKLGFFFSQNSAGKDGGVRGIIWQKFLDRYFPYTPPDEKPLATAEADAKRVAGLYESSRGFRTSIARAVMLGDEIKVFVNSDGTLGVSSYRAYSGAPKHLAEVAPMFFREVHGQEAIAFLPDGRAAVTFPAMALLPLPWHDNQTLGLTVLAVSLGILALNLILWPVAAATRRHYGQKLDLSFASRRARRWARTAVALDLAFAVLLLAVSPDLDVPGDLNHKMDNWMYLVQVIGVLGAAGTVLVFYNTLRAWRDDKHWWFARVQETAVLLACIGFVWFCWNWNLFRFNARF
jgi:CubicO group peptidase (beta-lactamase class C family)